MAQKKFKLNLLQFFQKESKNLIKTYKRLISRGQGIELDSSPKKKTGSGVWMKATGETNTKGYGYKATRTSMSVFALDKKHSGNTIRGYKQKNPPTYKDIFSYHNQVRGWSGVFGNKLPAGSKFPQRLVKEAGIQISRWAKGSLKGRNIKIG
ncbi:MAG: hypothetical protein Unbinned4311contig1001_25 [Prokaryotic dsDNA virus sp.]|nr:MAG: hypothetical protein Unbinned4311contig1001_25 [Prokaryotic dsDNA virus sp.]|tara:strand:+ start:192 stop:647 length:456 start_codon:yes stop_codon:yes gene_type:complete